MAILLNIPNRKLDKVAACLADKLSNIGLKDEDVAIYPNHTNPDDVTMAVVWKHEPGSLREFTNLKAISSFGAGVDAVFADEYLPDVPLCRIVDPKMSDDMAKFIWSMIQHHKLRLSQFSEQKMQKRWKPKTQHKGSKVGILGLGELGQTAAKLLSSQGFDVSGWSRSQKDFSFMRCLSGEEGFQKLVSSVDYLVCLLPLTDETSNLLNKKVFAMMQPSSVLINVARGQHVVDEDLVNALASGHLDAAYLDVFRKEPLPQEHPFWDIENIFITPHISAVTNLAPACEQIAQNYQRLLDGKVLQNTVNKSKGY